ncbi:MAG: hypothetical protein J6W39_02090 [Spirochaetales bacterium]|nr:hypothetical protein [Spirochaetales bacterium]
MALFATNIGEVFRIAGGTNASEKVQSVVLDGCFGKAFANPLPSLHPVDLLVGIAIGAILRFAVYMKGKNAKKFRHNVEYGSARWGTHADIEPYMDPVFQNNVILSQTERLTMESRPANPKYARNKNVLVVGGSGSGKTRFVLKPNLLPRYSVNNQILIMLQRPDATMCQSFGGWKDINRFVRKGEKGIRILAPAPYKMQKEQDKTDASGRTILDKDGEPVKGTVEITVNAFKPVSTFDISQTEGDPVPTLGVAELTGSV